MTQSGHARAGSKALGMEVYVGCVLGWAETDGFSLGDNRRFAALTLIHRVHNHTDDDGNDGTTHTTADQLTGDRC